MGRDRVLKKLRDLISAEEIDFDAIPVDHTDSFEHTISESDVETFAKLTHDLNPLHIDKEFAREAGFGKPVVYGMLSASFISTMIGMLIPGKGALWSRQTIEFVYPSYVGDTLTVTARIVQKSTSTRTLVLNIEITNQNSQVILRGESQVKVLKKKAMSTELSAKMQKKAILVTGGSRGIGAATALKAAADGYLVGINYKSNDEEAQRIVAQIESSGGLAIALKADVSKIDEVNKLVATMLERFGTIDAFAHCAAPHPVATPFEESSWDGFQNHLDVQVKGAYLVSKALIPHFVKAGGGSIVFVSSIYADGTPPPQMASYVVAKSALSALARSLAVELGPKAIRVNVVSPGITITDMTSQVPEKTKLLAKMNTPLRRLGEPEDIAKSIAFLIGSEANHISGENLRVCGGVAML